MHTLAWLGLATYMTGCSNAPQPTASQGPDGPLPVAAALETSAAVTSLGPAAGSSGVMLGLGDGHVAVWNGRDAAPALMLKPHAARVIAVAASADGRDVWSVAVDGLLARTPMAAGARSSSRTLDLGTASTRAAAFASDGSLLVTGGEFGDLRVFDTESGVLRHVLRGHRTEIQALAVRPGGQTVASASAESDLRIWDATSGTEMTSIESELSLFAVAFSPLGDVLASGGVDRRLTLRDPASWATVAEISLPAPRLIAALAWSPDGRFLALADIDDESLSKGRVDIIDATSRQVVATLDSGGLPAAQLTVLPDGLVVAAAGSTLRSWVVPALAPSRR